MFYEGRVQTELVFPGATYQVIETGFLLALELTETARLGAQEGFKDCPCHSSTGIRRVRTSICKNNINKTKQNIPFFLKIKLRFYYWQGNRFLD